MAAAATEATILELDPSHERAGRVIDDIVRLEKRIFPKHESLARSFHDELKRRNTGLIYSTSGVGDDEEVAGYAMYTCATSLCASITKLAGETLALILPPCPVEAFGLNSWPVRACSEGELPEAGPGRGAAAGRRGQVPEAAGPAGVPPRRPGEDGRGSALPEGRVPGGRHHRGLLLRTEECLPDVHGSLEIIRIGAPRLLHFADCAVVEFKLFSSSKFT
uniref:Uncharacterized protein n=1 Tax=Aegilops tauschii subsp. strangulata TaxID=200361 RepID=A0A452YJY5_AEGTS